MIREFEGKTEQEAIARALEELQVVQDDIDIEVVESEKRSLFKKGNVKIRVYLNEEEEQQNENEDEDEGPVEVNEEFEENVITFLSNLLIKMGYPGSVDIVYRKHNKLGLDISSEYSSIIIGKKGKNLDAIQLIVNVYAGQLQNHMKVMVDSENYRMRHEEFLVRLAFKTAQSVKKSGRSKLLEPMNPFERRLVHTALNGIDGIETKSEGDGLFKQVRISVDDSLPPLRK
ncbi:MAG: Jag N-terminal domain-containing protein [Sphaerochaetaceae bacterium]|nr:Jag N-terminal domain-containing protein [Sphaerochaetaceae bacterium]